MPSASMTTFWSSLWYVVPREQIAELLSSHLALGHLHHRGRNIAQDQRDRIRRRSHCRTSGNCLCKMFGRNDGAGPG